MITVNVFDIPFEGLTLSGSEPPEFLELEEIPGLGLKPLSDVVYELNASMAGSDLLVTGSARIKIHAECCRCLMPFEHEICKNDVCIHIEKVQTDAKIDIAPYVREDILLEIPTRFLCSPDCKGICPGCGADLNTEKCRCGHSRGKKKKQGDEEKHGDPVWSALDGLKI